MNEENETRLSFMALGVYFGYLLGLAVMVI
jgi:hypothetical protein